MKFIKIYLLLFSIKKFLVYFFDIQFKNSENMEYHNVFSFLFLFFEFFGTKFDFDMYGISLNKDNPGTIFYKYGNYYMDDYENICVEKKIC